MAPRNITGTGRARQRHDLLGILRAERRLQDAAAAALQAWLPTVEQGVFGTLTAAGTPNAQGVYATVAAWREVLDAHLLPEVEQIMLERMVEHLEATGVAAGLPDPPEGGQPAEGVARAAIYNAADPALAAVAYSAPGVREWQQHYLAQVFNRLVRVPDTVFELVAKELDASLALGEDPRTRATRIRDVLTYTGSEQWPHRAITIARTEATGAYNQASVWAAKARGLQYDEPLRKVWLATVDGRTRDSHFAADGQVVDLDGQFVVGTARLEFPGDPTGPAREVINCVVGDTRLDWTGQGVVGATRRRYSGTLVQLVTAGGHHLTVTPNHPVLTPSGYVAAGALQQGDSVLATGSSGLPQVQDRPATAEQVFSAAREAGQHEWVAGSRVDFHGDVPDTEVEVVRADRVLWDERHTGILQRRSEQGFGRLLDAAGTAAGDGSTGTRAQAGGVLFDPLAGLVSAGDVRRAGESLAFSRSHARHAQAVRFRAAADRKAEFAQAANNQWPGDVEVARHLQHADAIGMEPVQLLQVDMLAGDHWVYNLHTTENWFSANGIVLHNCRCTVMELGPDDDLPPELDRQTERGEGDATVRNREGTQQDEINRRAADGVVRARDATAPTDAILAAGPTEEHSMTQHWKGVLAPMGKTTGDGRMFADDASVAFRDFPLPLMWQRQTADGHAQAYTVGSIRSASIEGDSIVGEGVFFDTPEALEAVEQVREGVTRPSVDLADDEWRMVDEDGQEITEEAYWEAQEEGEEPKLVMQFTSFTVMAATLVAKPAFAEARLELTEEDTDGAEAGTEAALTEAEAGLVAAAAQGGSPVYDTTHFTDPRLTGPTALHMREDGRIVGHLALWNDCHMGVGDACVMAPRTRTGYSLFHVAEVQTDQGPLAVGKLTVGGGHASPRLGVQPTIEHYDNAGTGFALVRAGEDEHGIWVSGVSAPWASVEQVQLGLSCPLSGDWRRHGGNLELVAALSVNTPGFPVPRGKRDEKGRDYALVAAGVMQPQVHSRDARLLQHIDATVRDAVQAAMASMAEQSTLQARQEAMAEKVARIRATRIDRELGQLARTRAAITRNRTITQKG